MFVTIFRPLLLSGKSDCIAREHVGWDYLLFLQETTYCKVGQR